MDSEVPVISKNPEVVNVDTALRVLSQVNLLVESNALALDIGGSLAKILYLQPHDPSMHEPRPLKIHRVDGSITTTLSVRVPILHGTLHFFATETRYIHKLLKFIRSHWAHAYPAHRNIRATGGGAYKYAETFRKEIGVTLSHLDEMKCTVAGLNFLLTSVDNEVYYYENIEDPLAASPSTTPSLPNLSRSRHFVDSTQRPFPYLLVNIGSGVSIVKVTNHDCFERVSGSSLGGGTFWGLSRLLLNCETFDDVINLTRTGNNSNVDMLVGDIYGGAYSSLGLDAAVLAASFGKATMKNNDIDRNGTHGSTSVTIFWQRLRRAIVGTLKLWTSVAAAVPVLGGLLRAVRLIPDSSEFNVEGPMLTTVDGEQFRPQDVALSLLRMVSYNIAQIAHLNARVHGLNRIYFGGNFIRDHPYTIADLSFAVDFWSRGEMKALFLRHDGYLGAIGAFIGASSATPTKMMEEAKWSREGLGLETIKNVKMEKEIDDSTSSTPVNDTAESIESRHISKIAVRPPHGKLEVSKPEAGVASNALSNDLGPISTNSEALENKFSAPLQTSNGTTKRRKRGNRAGGTSTANDHNSLSQTVELSSKDSEPTESVLKNTAGAISISGGDVSNEGGWTTVTKIRKRGEGEREKP